jgi:hypothetical protein
VLAQVVVPSHALQHNRTAVQWAGLLVRVCAVSRRPAEHFPRIEYGVYVRCICTVYMCTLYDLSVPVLCIGTDGIHTHSLGAIEHE